MAAPLLFRVPVKVPRNAGGNCRYKARVVPWFRASGIVRIGCRPVRCGWNSRPLIAARLANCSKLVLPGDVRPVRSLFYVDKFACGG